MANEFLPIFDLGILQELSEPMDSTTHILSDTTRLLCLDLLTRRVTQRWCWFNDDEPISDEDWDEAQYIVDKAVHELLLE